jgi:hypothetical protein
MVAVPKNTKLLPPRNNERIVGVKTNKLGEVTCVKYTTATLVSLLTEFMLLQVKSNSFLQEKLPKDLRLPLWKKKPSALGQP